MIETHLDKINVSSKDIFRRAFQINEFLSSEKENKLLELKTSETQTSIPLNRPQQENRLNFNPITNINNRNEQIDNKAEKED